MKLELGSRRKPEGARRKPVPATRRRKAYLLLPEFCDWACSHSIINMVLYGKRIYCYLAALLSTASIPKVISEVACSTSAYTIFPELGYMTRLSFKGGWEKGLYSKGPHNQLKWRSGERDIWNNCQSFLHKFKNIQCEFLKIENINNLQ